MPKNIRYYTSKSCKDGTLLTVSVAERNLRRQEKDNIVLAGLSSMVYAYDRKRCIRLCTFHACGVKIRR